MRDPARILWALAATVLIAACSAGSATPAPPDPSGPGRQGADADAGALDGRTFLSTGIDGRALVPGSQVRLMFGEGRLGANAGCNSLSGPYAIDGGRLVVAALATTEMACDPALMEQDTWLAAFLDGAAAMLEGDVLTLAKDGVTLALLDREVADPDRPLVGTRWVVDGLVSGDAVSSMPAGIVATLVFGEDRVDVEVDCNSGGGPVEVGVTTLVFGALVTTKMACHPDALPVEQAVTAALAGRVTYAIEADTLTLDAGDAGLVLRAAP